MEASKHFGEYARCADSKWYFTKFIKTEHKLEIDGQYITRVENYPDYPYLKDMLSYFDQVGNEHHEKSRQMLWSWSAMLDSLHDITFRDNNAEKIISRKEVLVDDGGQNSTTDSLFGRLYFMWSHLPSYLKAPLVFTHLKIVNPLNGSYIKGESTNIKAGRGGTYNKVKCDEWAFIENSESVYTAIKAACPNNIKLGSTPNGKGNNFARIRLAENTGFNKHSFHWTLHPQRDQEWYFKVTRGYTSEQKAREYDLSYEGSVEGRVFYNFDYNEQIRAITYNRGLPTFTGWDFGIADPTAIVVIQENPNGEIYVIDEYENSEQGPEHYADWLKSRYKERVADIGDPAGKQRGVKKSSWFSELKLNGIRIKAPLMVEYKDRIMYTRKIIPKLYVSDKCVKFIDRMMNYRFPTNDDGSVKEGSKPVHNWASHMMTALEFYSVYRHGLKSLAKVI